MKFWRNVSPRGAVGDFVEQWRKPQPYRWQILGIAVALTFTMMTLLIPKSERIPPERPTVTYITTFDSSRTDAQIVESNEANQLRKDEAAALKAQRAERSKEMARALGRATGIDVDAMERRIKADQAAEAAAKAQADEAAEAKAAAQASPAPAGE